MRKKTISRLAPLTVFVLAACATAQAPVNSTVSPYTGSLQAGQGRVALARAESALDVYDARAMALLQDVGLASFADTAAAALPYGRKRALEIATTLPLDPQLLLLDEPTAGMTHEDVARTMALIKSVSAGRTVLMVEHNLSVVEGLCEYVTVMTRGSILAEGSYAEVSRNPDVIAALFSKDVVFEIPGDDGVLPWIGHKTGRGAVTDFIRGLQADVSDEAGQTMAEYAVVLGVITIAVVVTLGLLSTAIKNTLNNVISVI